MPTGLPSRVVIALTTAGLLSTWCSGWASAAPASLGGPSSNRAAHQRTWSVVALGDSVPRGTNCHCTAYPPLTAKDLEATTGQTVVATNDSVAGVTTSYVLKQLTSDARVIKDVSNADAIEIEVGANDVGFSGSCGPHPTCYRPRVATVERNLRRIVARVHELTAGHRTLVILLDYWSVWLGGKYAASEGAAYVDSAAKMTMQINTIIRATARDNKSAYVDLRTAFKGPSFAYDETHYLAPDGDHPNAAGHRLIALATQSAIESALHL